MGTYDVAQICRNGHVINSMARNAPEIKQEFCDRCGEPTLTSCQKCDRPIRGYYDVPGVIGGFDYSAPSYCHACGAPHPWTEARLAAAQELAETFDELSDEEQGQLKQSLEDLTRDTPRTAVAESRFKRLVKKAGADAYEGMRSILVEVVSESVKKSLFGP